jgi:hypothetical protein
MFMGAAIVQDNVNDFAGRYLGLEQLLMSVALHAAADNPTVENIESASYPGFEPVCMIRPVSDAASNSHPVAALSCRLQKYPACVGQGLRRAGPFSSSAF